MAQDNKYAVRIRDYWSEQGYTVTTHTAPVPESHHGTYMTVRSDLHNGLPLNYKNGKLGVTAKGKV